MKQVVQNFKTGELMVAEVPVPSLQPGGVLVAVSASLISPGTERMVVDLAQASLLGKARQRPDQVRQVINKIRQVGPLTTYQQVMNRLDTLTPLGYSCAGTVIGVGENVTELQVGDPVACAGGGYANHAEYVFVPQNLVARVPSLKDRKIPFTHAAFTTLGAIALQGLRQAAPTLGETIAVIGLGLLGQLTSQLLKANGCRVLGMDLNSTRCQLAESLGCDRAVPNAPDFLDLTAQWTGGRGADAVLITAGTSSNAPIELAADICRDRGRIIAIGLVNMDIPRRPFYDKELDLRLSRSYGPGRYDPSYEEGGQDYPIGYVRWTENRNMAAFLDLLAQGKLKLDPLISDRFEIKEALQAYERITNTDKIDAIGIILTYPDSDVARSPEGTIWLQQSDPSGPQQLTHSSKGPLSIGLIGTGTFAQGVLLPALKGLKMAKLSGVSNASGPKARHVAEKYQAAYCSTDPRDLFNDGALDAVIITTRHDSHAALTIQGLEAGKHVFVEKPLALNENQLQAVINSYQASQKDKQGALTLMVGFNRRFAPLAVRLKSFRGKIKDPIAVHYQVNAGPIPRDHWIHDPEIGGGRILGEVCHFIDFLIFLIGDIPISLFAQALPNDGRYFNDNVITTLRFADGSLGSVAYLANGDKTYPKEQIHLSGGGAVAALHDFRSLKLVKSGKTKIHRTLLQQDKGHEAELDTFIKAICDGTALPIPFQELVLSTRTTFKIAESLQSGMPVEVKHP